LIVNADDFGLGARENEAILRAFDAGLISSTTIMPNMPGFAEAASITIERGLIDHVGAHLVLTEGEPLTDAMRACRRFCDADGRFVFWRLRDRAVWLSSDERRLVSAELRAQIARCRESGLRITHLDTHHNVHNQPGIAPVVLHAASELGVPAVRVLENTAAHTSMRNRASVRYFNRCLRRAGLARTRYFGTVDAHGALAARGAPPAELDDFEVVTHPTLDARGEVVDALQPDASLRELVTQLPNLPAAVSYAGAAYR
jgi:predicted glycoside hydrolase/deacetylase ChbG (UPF0249 family)